MADRAVNLETVIGMVNTYFRNVLNLNPDLLIDGIVSLPTVDAVPVKHGRWIYHPDWQADGECGYECSECGMGSDVDYPYCMLCGARMEREGR